jgi:hypothetical protein
MNIVLLTKNKFKSDEVKKIMSGYGLNIIIYKDYSSKKDSEIVEDLKLEKCVLIREKTLLINNESKISADCTHLEAVTHISSLNVYFYENNSFVPRKYQASISGFINLDKKQNSKDIYNWDDIFVSLKTMKSYYEMRDTNGKFSARSVVLSDLLHDITKFEEKKDLRFNPFNQKNVISFSEKIYDLIEDNKYMKVHRNSEVLSGLINKVKSNGLFTRSSIDKKQRNYWYPALNAGLPLVSKKDEIHEITFMFHDLMHHLIPDLIHTGNSTALSKEAYVIHRMLSESFTIVLADMIYVDEISRSGIDYDFNKRKIYPMFKSMNIKNLDINELKKVVWANVNFALLGEDKLLKEKASIETVELYTKKYEKFFIEDYRWTINNFNNMDLNKNTMSKWFSANKDKVDKKGTIDYFANKINEEMSYPEKVSIIFEEVWLLIEEAMLNQEILNKEKATSEAFKRYMVGQSILFFKNDFYEHSSIFFNLIEQEIRKEILNSNDINKIRNFFNLYIDKLIADNMISKNEGGLYKEVVPLFEAYYVFYDSQLQYNSIKEVLLKEKLK